MGFFNRKRDVVDLTNLRKRGIIKEDDKDEFSDSPVLDLSNPSSTTSVSQNSSSSGSGGFDFLGALANANSNSENSEKGESNSYVDKLRERRMNRMADNHLKVKFEDLEYKFDRLVERLEKIEERLGL